MLQNYYSHKYFTIGSGKLLFENKIFEWVVNEPRCLIESNQSFTQDGLSSELRLEA